MEVELIDGDGIVARGMGAFAAVARGSHVEPRLIVLTNLQTQAYRANATAVTEGLLASLVFTMWVLWTAWAVKIDQPADPPVPGVTRPVGV